MDKVKLNEDHIIICITNYTIKVSFAMLVSCDYRRFLSLPSFPGLNGTILTDGRTRYLRNHIYIYPLVKV